MKAPLQLVVLLPQHSSSFLVASNVLYVSCTYVSGLVVICRVTRMYQEISLLLGDEELM